jgi:hypothetical protein
MSHGQESTMSRTKIPIADERDVFHDGPRLE